MSQRSSFLLVTNFLLLAFFDVRASEKFFFSIDGHSVEFFQDDAKRLMLSAGCKSGAESPEFKCQAYDVLKKVSLKGVHKYLKGGKNPGAVICQRQLKARVAMGTDAHGNQNSFCGLPDGSFVDNGTLTSFARVNDSR